MPNITVFCSASEVADHYVDSARRLGQLMGEQGYDLVWGGSNVGLMRVIADSVQAAGGRLIGITVEMLKASRRLDADEMIITPDLAERKKMLLARGDAIVLLVGGIGSLDEISEVLEFKKHGSHAKPIVVLNTAGFYDGLQTQLTRMYEEGFLTKELSALLSFAESPEVVMDQLKAALPAVEGR